MPIYGYRCNQCDHEFEVHQSMSAEPLRVCPECGGALRKLLYPVGVQFKGSGFYSTDYKRGGAAAAKSETNGSGDAKESKQSKDSAKESKESTGSKEPAAGSSGGASSESGGGGSSEKKADKTAPGKE